MTKFIIHFMYCTQKDKLMNSTGNVPPLTWKDSFNSNMAAGLSVVSSHEVLGQSLGWGCFYKEFACPTCARVPFSHTVQEHACSDDSNFYVSCLVNQNKNVT